MAHERLRGALSGPSLNGSPGFLTPPRVRAALVRPVAIFIRFARRQPLGGIAAIILTALAVVAIISPFATPRDPRETHIKERYASPGSTVDGERSILGTDNLGRDILSRLMYGTRTSFFVALVAVGVGVTVGALVGLITAYIGGMLDLLVQRVVDAFMAFPALIFALGLAAVFGGSVKNVVLTLAIVLIPGASRVIRSQALALKETDYIAAARAVGSSEWRIMFRHLLPNCLAPYIVFATANLGFAIVVEASLSYLGLGAPAGTPSWGGMLSVAGQKYVEVSPWLLIFPSLAVSIVVFSFNMLGDALRDVLDPKLRA